MSRCRLLWGIFSCSILLLPPPANAQPSAGSDKAYLQCIRGCDDTRISCQADNKAAHEAAWTTYTGCTTAAGENQTSGNQQCNSDYNKEASRCRSAYANNAPAREQCLGNASIALTSCLNGVKDTYNTAHQACEAALTEAITLYETTKLICVSDYLDCRQNCADCHHPQNALIFLSPDEGAEGECNFELLPNLD